MFLLAEVTAWMNEHLSDDVAKALAACLESGRFSRGSRHYGDVLAWLRPEVELEVVFHGGKSLKALPDHAGTLSLA